VLALLSTMCRMDLVVDFDGDSCTSSSSSEPRPPGCLNFVHDRVEAVSVVNGSLSSREYATVLENNEGRVPTLYFGLSCSAERSFSSFLALERCSSCGTTTGKSLGSAVVAMKASRPPHVLLTQLVLCPRPPTLAPYNFYYVFLSCPSLFFFRSRKVRRLSLGP